MAGGLLAMKPGVGYHKRAPALIRKGREHLDSGWAERRNLNPFEFFQKNACARRTKKKKRSDRPNRGN